MGRAAVPSGVRLARSWMAIAASALTALASAGSASAQTLPQVPPPSLISPMLSVGVPVLFEWTPVNPGNLYNFYLQSHTRTPAAASPFVVYYELQISDAADVTSHVLVDITTSTTIFSFQNQNIPGSGFTSLQRPGLPLPAGLYYWRVRALVNTAATAFSSIGRFSLDLGTGGGISTPFHDMAITSLVITAPAYVGTASVIVVTVQNTGTFPEQGSPLTITANGEQIARVDTPSTAAGETARITAIWTPSRRGLAQIASILNFSGPNPDKKFASISPPVADQPQFATAIHGTLRLGSRGYFLADAHGREIALVLLAPGAQLDLQSLVGRAVILRGTMTKHQSSLIFAANQVALAP
jgi:hypothetical protein